MPGRPPLNENQLAGELKARRDALLFPGILSHIPLKEVASQGVGSSVPGAAPPLWREMLTPRDWQLHTPLFWMPWTALQMSRIRKCSMWRIQYGLCSKVRG